MRYVARHRFADMSARKIRPFARMIRGMTAQEAMEKLAFFHNKGARLIEQVLKSAQGNAADRGAQDIEELEVIEARVDGGPMMKRIRPRARGTAYLIRKRTAHIHVTLADEVEFQIENGAE